MHHYPHHIGDYTKDTMHLSPLEHGVYRLLMDAYYATEKPLPGDFLAVCRIARSVSQDEQAAVRTVLAGFFTETPEGYRNKRIDIELTSYWARADANRANGKNGGRPRNPTETQSVSQSVSEDEPKAKAKPNPKITLTNNQEPITKTTKAKATRLPDGFAVSDALRAWAEAEGYANLDAHLAYFRDWAIAGDKRYVDWDATFRNAIRGNWARVKGAGPAAPAWEGAK